MKSNSLIEIKRILIFFKIHTEKSKFHPTTFLCCCRYTVAERGCSVWFHGKAVPITHFVVENQPLRLVDMVLR